MEGGTLRELLTYLAMFQVVLSVILYVCIVVKWHVLKSRIKANSWEQASPCGLQTVILFLIPVFGPMCFLAAMTILDDAARYTKEESGNHLNVQIGPMRFTFSESV
jgi:hypothetical protein